MGCSVRTGPTGYATGGVITAKPSVRFRRVSVRRCTSAASSIAVFDFATSAAFSAAAFSAAAATFCTAAAFAIASSFLTSDAATASGTHSE